MSGNRTDVHVRPSSCERGRSDDAHSPTHPRAGRARSRWHADAAVVAAGNRDLWVEVYEPELDVTIVIPAKPERALETFRHPYAYAAADGVL